MNAILADLSRFLVTQSIHLALLFGLIWMLALFFRKHSAHLRYLLWSVILIKCLVPPLVTVPVAMLPERIPAFEQSVLETGAPADAPVPVATTQESVIDIGPPPIATPAPAAQFPANPVQLSPPEAKEATSSWATLSPLQWAGGVWVTGLVLLACTTVVRALRFGFWLRRKRRPGDDCLQRQIDYIVQRHWPGKRIRTYQLKDVSQPFVWGLTRGAMYLTANFNTTGTDSTRRSVLLHEIAHVIRRDPLINLVQIIVQWIYWFHPVVWIANRMIRCEREKCCDEIAIARLDTSPKEYGSAIVNTLVNEYTSRRAIPTLAVAGPIKNIEDRIKTIMKPGKRFYTRPTIKALVLTLLLASVITPTTVALTRRGHSQDPTTVTFPNGTRVELVGLCESPSPGKPWWRPDGFPLDDLSIVTEDANPQWSGDPAIEIVYRVTGDFPVTIDSIRGVDIKSALIVSQPEGLSAVRAHLQAGLTETDITIASPTGKWETVTRLSGLGSTHNTIGWKKIILSVTEQDGKGLVVSATDEVGYKQATRVVAIDKNGQKYVGMTQSDLSVKGLRQRTVYFPNLAPADLKTVAFQVCPYDHYTFKHVKLRPEKRDRNKQQNPTHLVADGQTKWPIVDTGSANTVALPNGATIELLGARRYPSTESMLWTPDGASKIDAPYDKLVLEVPKVYEGRTWEMAVRLVGTDRQFIEDAKIDWDIPSNTSMTVTSVKKDGQVLKHTSVVVFSLKETQAKCDIRIAAAAGPWNTLSSIRADRKSEFEHYLKDGTKTIWSPPKDIRVRVGIPDSGNPSDTEAWSQITGYTHKDDIQLRVVAISKTGLMISGSAIKMQSKGDRHYFQYHFPNILSEVKEFQLQYRPYEWTTFNNIILETDNALSLNAIRDGIEDQLAHQNWYRFRGPGGAGICPFANIPTQWDGPNAQTIRWKSPVPLPGKNSPIVWGDRVFCSGADEETMQVFCYSTETGRMLWGRDVPVDPEVLKNIEVMEDTGLAANTMATDGICAYAIFATGDVVAFDFSGKRLWHQSLGIPDSAYGYATSLECAQGWVFVQFDQGAADEGKSFVLALDGKTGKRVWETSRAVANGWTSPILAEIGGQPQLITMGVPSVIAYDPRTGRPLWQADCLDGDVAPSPIIAGDLVIAIEPYSQMVAIHADGQGDVTNTHIAWRNEEGGPDMCSPVADDGYIYLLDGGELICIRIADGREIYRHDLDAEFAASPSIVGDHLYLLDTDGTMHIVRTGPDKPTSVKKCVLGEECAASPAFSDGKIFIRGEKYLYCIGE